MAYHAELFRMRHEVTRQDQGNLNALPLSQDNDSCQTVNAKVRITQNRTSFHHRTTM